MTKAVWNGRVLAESNDCEVVDGNSYFPPDSVDRSLLQQSETQTTCPWKGVAQYYHVVVNGQTHKDAAWYYPHASKKAKLFEGYVAFWKDVEVET